ncbi:hypothetical protein [Gemmata obscuriglobus]|uniref:hypothetical protein n=1 Tax=Gemmata obscuriglobus TaxID=114 RepID=UPI0011CE3C22|nr:hypothetical protein [Gemmata obscuriglobus]
MSKGEIATHDLKQTLTAVSLTTQTDPDTLLCWSTRLPVKTAVRYACRIPDGDVRLEPALAAWKRLGVPAKTIRNGLNPAGQAKWWSFFHGVIPPDCFTVELWGRAGYVPLTSPDKVISEVAAARAKFVFSVPPDMPWALAAERRDEGDASADWLMSETHPADRFK